MKSPAALIDIGIVALAFFVWSARGEDASPPGAEPPDLLGKVPLADFTRSRSTNYERNDYRPPQRTVYQDRDRNDEGDDGRSHALAEGSPPAWDPTTHAGFWRHLMLREADGRLRVSELALRATGSNSIIFCHARCSPSA